MIQFGRLRDSRNKGNEQLKNKLKIKNILGMEFCFSLSSNIASKELFEQYSRFLACPKTFILLI